MVEGMEVGMIVVCGKVNAVERAATKTTYHLEDNSGTLEVVQWIDEGSAGAEHNEGDEVKVVGSVRTQGEKKLGMGSSSAPSSGQSFGHKNYDLVYQLIKSSTEEQGVDRDNINQQVRTKMSKQEMDSALDYLSSEGHIYSTIDEDHFKTTDE